MAAKKKAVKKGKAAAAGAESKRKYRMDHERF